MIDSLLPRKVREANLNLGLPDNTYSLPDSTAMGVWVEAVGISSNQSGVHPDSILKIFPMPPLAVDSKVSLRFVGTEDSITCGDSIKVVLDFSNPVFPPQSISWNYLPIGGENCCGGGFFGQYYTGFKDRIGSATYSIRHGMGIDSIRIYATYEDQFNGQISKTRIAKVTPDSCFILEPLPK